MDSNREEKNKKENGTYEAVGKGKQPVSCQNAEGVGYISQLGHFRDRLRRMVFFTKYK